MYLQPARQKNRIENIVVRFNRSVNMALKGAAIVRSQRILPIRIAVACTRHVKEDKVSHGTAPPQKCDGAMLHLS